jgi:hypothetical protein
MSNGYDVLRGKGCTRMCPKLHLPVLGTLLLQAHFPGHWCHGIVRHLEGCAVSHRSIREVATVVVLETETILRPFQKKG